MKTLTLTTVVIGTLLAADGAYAKHDDDRQRDRHQRAEQQYDDEGGDDRQYDHRYERNYDHRHDRKYDREQRRWHRNDRYVNRHDVRRIDIPVRIRGDERVPLRRLLRKRYDINPNHYNLRKVVVFNDGRHASARLRVGDYVSERRHLHYGRNQLWAPRHSDGRWTLGLSDARVDHIRVVLEPKKQLAAHRYPYRWKRQSRWF